MNIIGLVLLVFIGLIIVKWTISALIKKRKVKMTPEEFEKENNTFILWEILGVILFALAYWSFFLSPSDQKSEEQIDETTTIVETVEVKPQP